jgi:alpha-mannosidase
VINDDCASIMWSDKTEWMCDDASCPTPFPNETIDVHIVCHTHDDTGYLSTVEEYYQSNVQHILTTVTTELQKNPARRFSYVETKFFAMWWELQTEATKTAVRKLVKDGQLDFSNGGV